LHPKAEVVSSNLAGARLQGVSLQDQPGEACRKLMDIDAGLFVHARLFRCQHAYEQNALMQRVHVLEMVRESKWNAAVADERKVALPGKRAGGCSISLVRSSAITTALSPDNTMFTPVICSSAIEDCGGVEIASVSLSETHARIYWWCSPPKIGTANV